MTVPFTFHASVADAAISKVSCLFNATLDDIFAELFQNARRAGAAKIIVDQIDDPELGAVIRIVDDGPGLTDPKHLFMLGQSAWADQVTSVEDAAGINAVIRIVSRELYWLRRKSSSVTIRIVNGRVEVEGLDAKSHAA